MTVLDSPVPKASHRTTLDQEGDDGDDGRDEHQCHDGIQRVAQAFGVLDPQDQQTDRDLDQEDSAEEDDLGDPAEFANLCGLVCVEVPHVPPFAVVEAFDAEGREHNRETGSDQDRGVVETQDSIARADPEPECSGDGSWEDEGVRNSDHHRANAHIWR